MAAKKSKIVVHLENELYKVVQSLADQDNMSMSSSMRRIVIDNLHDKGLLPDDFLREIAR